MKRKDVYKLIDGEREYQDQIDIHSLEIDRKTPVERWAIYIEEHLNQLKKSIYMLDEETAKEQMRKIAALAVACMEYNETKPRK